MAPNFPAMLARQKANLHASKEAGTLSIGPLLLIVGVIIGAVVGMAVLAALLPSFFTSLADVGTVFSDPNTTTGNDDADNLLPIFGLLVAFAGLFAIVGLVILVITIKRKGGFNY